VTHSFDWVSVTAAVDWVDVTNNVKPVNLVTGEEVDDDDFYKRVYFGAEAKLWKRFALRGGFYQGYPSYGASLDLWALKLDYASYAEELGAYAGQTSDRRHVVQVTLGW